ncbi:hypothetical protein UlMin_008303 [Ulmus minor]
MGKTPCCDKQGLRKGIWTEEEDQKLLSYIKQHGEKHWHSLPQKAGLQRCGKSCRLRWANYLRPGINRAKFTPQEEELIIQLHSVLGNKWSTIARHLHRRTDNEIKNVWHTRIRRRLIKQGLDPKSSTNTLDIAGSLANNPRVANDDDLYNSIVQKSNDGDGDGGDNDNQKANPNSSVCYSISSIIRANSSTASANFNEVILPLSSPSPSFSTSSSAHILNKLARILNPRLHCLNAMKEVLSELKEGNHTLNKEEKKIALATGETSGGGGSHEPEVDSSICGSYNNIETPVMETLPPFYETDGISTQYMEFEPQDAFFEEIAKALEEENEDDEQKDQQVFMTSFTNCYLDEHIINL